MITGKLVFDDCFNVFFVAVSAYHDHSSAKLGVNTFVSYNFHRAVDYWNHDGFANVLAVPLVVGVNFDGDACRNKLGSASCDKRIVACAFEWEADVVQDAVALHVIYFSISNRGFIMWTPIHGMRAPVHVAFFVEQNEA